MQIILRLAPDMGELLGVRITTVTDSAHYTVALPTSTLANTYQWAWLKSFRSGVARVNSHDASGGLVLSAGLTPLPTAGETFGMAFWNANKDANVLAAINAFIDASYPHWYREVLIDQNSPWMSDGTIFIPLVLSADTDTYVLPSDLVMLSRIGIQSDATRPWNFESPPMDLWRVSLNEGVKYIKFYNNGRMYIPRTYAGEQLCLHYQAREPLLTSLSTASCQIPLDAFTGAAEYFKRRNLWREGRTDLITDNVALPQLQNAAAAAWARIGAIKQPLQEGPEYGWRMG